MIRACWAAAALIVVAGQAWAADAPAPIPVESFFLKPTIASATISPDARHVALIARGNGELFQLVVLDTSTLNAKVIFSFNDADVVSPHWINNKRLVFSAGKSENKLSESNDRPGLYAVDLDGGNYRQLASVQVHDISSKAVIGRMLDGTASYDGPMHNMDSDAVFVTQEHYLNRDFNSYDMLKLDTRTGETTLFPRPGRMFEWAIAPDDVPRVVATLENESRLVVQYLEGDKWTRIADFDIFTGAGGFRPVAFAPDGTFFVAYRKDEGTEALYTYDLKKKQLSAQPVFSVKGFDVDAQLLKTREGLVGIRYESDASSTYWIDARLKAIQAKIDKVLPATVNIVGVPFNAELPFVLVFAYSDADPGQYFLYDTHADKLVQIGRRRPAVDPSRMARRDFVHYKARDGLEVPAWVTTPKDGAKGPRPTVVLVHGGPNVRGGYWSWDSDSQFLASRGYLVIEPEYRGSTGFGFAHFKAGWKQWGLAMQNDVADVTRWAIEKGIADPKRICIAGASYGGYATLMGLIKDPDLYRCGFEWVGVTDLDLMYRATWSDASDLWRAYGMPVMVGDRNKDAEQLKATSPVNLASKVTRPILMGYGADDMRVPIDHGTSFRDAVAKTNKDVEWVVYSEEGHGWWRLKDNVDWWTRVEKFLARNIGN